MDRKPISGKRIAELHFNLEKLLKVIKRSELNIDISIGRESVSKTVKQVAKLLKEAHDLNIINLDYLADHKSWGTGDFHFEKQEPSGTYKLRTHNNKVSLTSENIKPYFTSIVGHAVNMAEAIMLEKEKKQPIKPLTNPYGQSNWLPAKLAA